MNNQLIKCFSIDWNTKPFCDYSMKLFKRTLKAEKERKDILVSPFSVFSLLTILANGAKGNTRRQVEEVLGIPADAANQVMRDFRLNLDNADRQLKVADSIWLRDDMSLVIEPDFLNVLSKYFNAEIFKELFDSDTLEKINRWVSDNSGGGLSSYGKQKSVFGPAICVHDF